MRAVKFSGDAVVAVVETSSNDPVDGLMFSETAQIGDLWTGSHFIAPSANVVRVRQWEAIKAKRDHLSDQGGYKVVVAGVDKWFHSDGKSKTQQLGLVMAGAGIPPVPWKTMDGSFVTMSQALAGQIFQAAMAQDQALFAAAEQHNAAMQSSADPAAYDFSSGWPATFPG